MGCVGCVVSCISLSVGEDGSDQLSADMAVRRYDSRCVWGGVRDCGDEPGQALADSFGGVIGEVTWPGRLLCIGDSGSVALAIWTDTRLKRLFVVGTVHLDTRSCMEK